jgi:hypothetical protein
LYEEKLVRVRVGYVSNLEWAILYDLKCNSGENYVWPVYDETDETCKAMLETLDKSLEGDPFGGSCVELVVVGRLKGSQKSGRRYGGQSALRYGPQRGLRLGFSISRIEEALPIPSTVPMPWAKRM